MLIIPSTTLHEVLPVILSSENESQGKGRYTITTFINIQNPTVYQS